ncbi:MAG TPA: aminotransferase class IV [Myxococcota bacterium]|nr:aminotransferase class IV [Myxococcota bacterium]
MSLSERRIWVNGRLVPWAEATVHVLSQSIQRGTLVFDVMPIYWVKRGPAILGLDEHVERFVQSMQLAGMAPPYGVRELRAGIAELVRANPGSELVKVSAYYPGVSLDVLPVDPKPDVALAAFSIGDVIAGGKRANAGGPAKLQIATSVKMPASVLSPQVKIAAGYTHAAFAKQRARAAGFHDVLFLDGAGSLTESSTQSFFLVVDGALHTGGLDSVLDGITRRLTIELARDLGYDVKEGRMPRELLGRAREAFLTGTTTNVWPIAQIDSLELPKPVPGPVSAKLSSRFKALVADEDPTFSKRWLQAV